MQTDLRPQSPLRAGTIECRDPATLERLGEVPALSSVEVAERVARARRAQVAWGRTGFAERRRVIRALLDRIVERQEDLCRLTARESGKTMSDALVGEVLPVCEKLKYLLKHGERDLRPEPRPTGLFGHKATRVEYPPLGVIGVLCPSSRPFHDVFGPTAAALFAGNAVVVKVSEWAAWSAADFQALFDEVLTGAALPRDLVHVIVGASDTGQALVTSGVDKVFFTGSPHNGRKVMEAAARTLTPVVLELGGKDPMIICDDADLDQVVETAMRGVFAACGQTGVAAERLYVMEGIYDRFVARVVEQARMLRQGPPSGDGRVDDARYDLGAVTTPRQLEVIQRLIDDAVHKGARVLVGGKRNPVWKGQFFEPTVLVDCDHSMAITREETVGPVMTIIRCGTEDEAVRLANDCEYGRGSSVFTRDRRRAERMARAISAGMTVVNAHGIAHLVPSAPFGGLRSSGFGKMNGREGLRACTAEKAIVTDRFPLPIPRAYPITRGSFGLMEGAISAVYGRGRARYRGLWRLVRAARDKWRAPRA
jgi:acyl-CoA reductase-like NAD-dependent aldehyde dehydrogenase